MPRGDIAERVTGRTLYDRPKAKNGLLLPGAPVPDRTATIAAPADSGAPADSAAAGPVTQPANPSLTPSVAPSHSAGAPLGSAARFVLDEVAKLRDVSSAMIDHGAQSLLRMGAAGRAAAFDALVSDHAPTTLLGAKTLLQFGDDQARDAVLQRMREKLPTQACTPMVNVLVALDPVHASPAYLGELLAHRQSGVRAAAYRCLADQGPGLAASALLVPLRAKEIDARARAVSLLARLEDPAAVSLLLERLTDASSTVGRRAVEALAARDEERIAGDLLRRAFDSQWIVREQALALVALCEREDLRFEAHLTDVHRARLLDGMTSNDPFVAGACAAALIGVGYRSQGEAPGGWYDLEAPHRLVRIVSSQDFAPDMSTLLPTAARRLALATGVDFGGDGPRWMAWWSERAGKFRCARAALEVDGDSALRLELRVQSTAGAADGFTLLGPGWAAREDATALPSAAGAHIYLSEPQARGAFEELRRLGLFSVERLPGLRGSPAALGQSLTVGVGGAHKTFRFTDARPAPWFDSALSLAWTLRQRNAWQELRDPAAHPTHEGFWSEEAAWWEAADDAQRARRMWELTLARAQSSAPTHRGGWIDRLTERAEDLERVTRDDATALLRLLADEPHMTSRGADVLDLALRGMRGDGSGEGALERADAGAVLDLLLARFGASAAPQAARVTELAGLEFTRAATLDERPFVRAVAATVLARSTEPRDAELLLAMLRDESEDVQSAVLLALGERKVEAARDDILLRARIGDGAVRLSALRATGLLGGDGALSALLAGLSGSEDPEVEAAAAQGLAALRESGAAPILVSLLSRGPQHPTFAHARAGLLALGERGTDELLRVVRSSSHRARREAALMLSEQLVPQVASALMTLLTEDPTDARVAEELAILTAVDFRAEASPSAAWWAWWEYVVHDDAQAWLSGALARLELGAPTPQELRSGSPAAVALLFELCDDERAHLVERARRELSRLAGRDLGRMPSRGRERELWLSTLRESFARAGR